MCMCILYDNNNNSTNNNNNNNNKYIYTNSLNVFLHVHYDTACTPRLTRIMCGDDFANFHVLLFFAPEARPATSTDVVVLSPGGQRLEQRYEII